MKDFTFLVHKHRLTGPELNNDMSITLKVDESQKEALAPFMFIHGDQPLEIIVKILDETTNNVSDVREEGET